MNTLTNSARCEQQIGKLVSYKLSLCTKLNTMENVNFQQQNTIYNILKTIYNLYYNDIRLVIFN